MEIPGVVQTVLDSLKRELITLRLKPGQKLNEEELACRMGISRPPLREAFRILAEDRLVKSISRKGAYAAGLSIKDLQDLLGVKEVLEFYAMDIFAARSQRAFRLLEEALPDRVLKADVRKLDEEERFACLQSLTDFHVKLVEEAGNSWLTDLYRRISASLMRYQYLYLSKGGTFRTSLQNHRRILAALRKGHYPEARDCIRSYAEHSFRILSRTMEGITSGGSSQGRCFPDAPERNTIHQRRRI